jgi:hypothetical protein
MVLNYAAVNGIDGALAQLLVGLRSVEFESVQQYPVQYP